MKGFLLIGAAACGLVVARPAKAQDTEQPDRFYVRVGVAQFDFDESAKIELGGSPVPGGNASVQNNTAASLEIGYFLSPRISIAGTFGIPPTTTLRGAGSLEAAGDLGTVTYGPGVYTVRYHFNPGGAVRPYVGAGVNWTIIFDTEDRALQNFKTSDTFGPALTVGVEAPLNDRVSLFGAISKAWISTDSTYDLPTPGGPVPGKARVDLDPFVMNVGLQLSF